MKGMLSAIIPIVVAVIGMCMYILASNGKVQELGRILFFCGAFVTVWILGGHKFNLP